MDFFQAFDLFFREEVEFGIVDLCALGIFQIGFLRVCGLSVVSPVLRDDFFGDFLYLFVGKAVGAAPFRK